MGGSTGLERFTFWVNFEAFRSAHSNLCSSVSICG